MLHAGLDLGRSSLVVTLLDDAGVEVDQFRVTPDGPGLGGLVDRVGGFPVRGVIESMNGARFVYDFLSDAGWQVLMADAERIRGVASLAAKTDRLDSRVLAELSRRDLVPQIWIPSLGVRRERERARFRVFLVHQRTRLKNRVHSSLITFGRPCPVSDLFGKTGRQLLADLDLESPWDENIRVCLELVDHYDQLIHRIEAELRRLNLDHPYQELLMTVPGVGVILAYTIAAEIGDITRFSSAKKLVGYTGLVPRVYQSGDRNLRGPLARHGPRFLRWALIEAAVHASRHPAFAEQYERTRSRLGPQKGPKVARVEVARRISQAIWWMLTRQEEFNPRGPARTLVA